MCSILVRQPSLVYWESHIVIAHTRVWCALFLTILSLPLCEGSPNRACTASSTPKPYHCQLHDHQHDPTRPPLNNLSSPFPWHIIINSTYFSFLFSIHAKNVLRMIRCVGWGGIHCTHGIGGLSPLPTPSNPNEAWHPGLQPHKLNSTRTQQAIPLSCCKATD